MPKLSQYVTVIGSELSAIATAVENAGPAGKTFIANEYAASKAEIVNVGNALANFASASTLGKISAGLAVLNVIGGAITFAETTYKNGETLFASDWPAIKGPIDNILALFSGVTPAPATPAVAALPASA
jgi:hypothetical protein